MHRLIMRLASVLDGLAGRWLDWRMERAVAATPELARFQPRKVEWQDGRWQFEGFSPAVPLLAEECARILMQSNAPNYLEFEFLPRIDRGLRPVALTVRWLDGEMPSAKATRLAAELERITTALAQCGITGIADEFHDPADAISQMARYIHEMDTTWQAVGEPEDYADRVFEVDPLDHGPE